LRGFKESLLGFVRLLSVAMALATPASILWKPATASGACRGGCKDGRHEGVRAELSGAAVAGRDREAQQWELSRQSCASRARVSCLLGGNKRVREF
jgi:hypothetical protein